VAVENIHERFLPVGAADVAPLIDSLSSRDDRLWPHEQWPAMRFDRPLEVGASGGHGPIRYSVEAYEPGSSVWFAFSGPKGLTGGHGYEVEAVSGGVVLRERLINHPAGRNRLSWPIWMRPMHDALIEDSLDKAERELTGTVSDPARWSRWVRVLRWALTKVIAPRR